MFNRSLAPGGDTLGSWWGQTRTKCSSQAKKPISMLAKVYEKCKERNRFEDMRRRKRRPQPLPTIKLNNFFCQPLGQEKGDSLSNLNCHRGCGMGSWLILVSPSFRENTVATCKIGSFLYSLDNLLQKNVIVLFFVNQISKWRSFEKRAIFDLLFTFFSHEGKVTKIPSAHISHTYLHVFCSSYWLFLPYQFWKKKYVFIRYGFSLVWVLVLILIRAILEQSINNKMVSKI